MNLSGARAVNQEDFKPLATTMPLEFEFETNIYLESVLPNDANQPFSFQGGNPKILPEAKTVDGFRLLFPNPLVSTNNLDPTFTPQYNYLRAEGK